MRPRAGAQIVFVTSAVILWGGVGSVTAQTTQPSVALLTATAPSSNSPARPTEPPTGTSAETAPTAAPPAPTTTSPEAAKPAPMGFERFSDNWPQWLQVGLQYRGRVESAGPSSLVDGPSDGYYLNRVRLRTTVAATRWLSGSVEMQDSHVLDYDAGTVPRAMSDTFDLRQGFAEVAVKARGREYLVRAGRQELTFGEGRLIASPDWGNTNRTYDIVRTGFGMSGLRLDAFGGRVVQMEPGGFNRHVPGERFYGAYSVFSKAVPKTTIEPYVVVRTLATATGELGTSGDATVRTYGARAIARPSTTIEVGVEFAVQRGHQATDSITAWAEHAIVTWAPARAPAKLQFSLEVNAASGDDDPRDGERNTFDQLYPSNHGKYGVADRIAWRNMRDLAVLTQFTPAKNWKGNVALRHLSLATVNDGYYGSSGSRALINRNATSGEIGWEADSWASWAITKELALGAGLSVLLAGDYLTHTTGVQRIWSPYVMWNVKF